MSTVTATIVVLSGLGLLLAVVLFLVARRFKVEEDPRIDEIEALMPGANCGGCGFAGCRAFAQAAVKAGNLETNYCPVGGESTMKEVAKILGIEAVGRAPMVAVVRCNGTYDARPRVNRYDGYRSCQVMSALYEGESLCRFGCLGCGDCADACAFGALSIDPETGLPVVDEEKCVACGNCVKACPKGIIELRNKGPRGMRVYVSCVNRDKGAAARKACLSACIGCGKCAKVCAHEAVTIDNNVCYIDFTKCKLCKKCVAECPTGAIHAVNFPTIVKKEASNE